MTKAKAARHGPGRQRLSRAIGTLLAGISCIAATSTSALQTTPGATFGNPAPLPGYTALLPTTRSPAPQTPASPSVSIFVSDQEIAAAEGKAASDTAMPSPVAPTPCSMHLPSTALPRPVDGAIITSAVDLFRIVQGRRRPHMGTDFGAPTGTPVKAIANGRVIERKVFGSYGHYVLIDHGHGFDSRYAHMSRFASGLRPGDCVTQGQVIAYVGATGAATGPHLHIELRKDDKALLPSQLGLNWQKEQ